MRGHAVLSSVAAATLLLSLSRVGHAQPGCFGVPATQTGSGTIIGTEGPDVIVGSSGSDIIYGLGGNDIICAGGGDDYVQGGDGDDRVDGGDGDDVVLDQGGNDWIDGGPGDQDVCVLGDLQGRVSNCELPRRPRTEPALRSDAGRSFRVCPGENSALAREIEQFIAGRSFSARLQSRADGCFDLTITVSSEQPSSGRHSAVVSIGSGSSGPGVSVLIVSEAGTTTVSIR